jgi:uncharacterized protein YchJ
VKTNDLDQFQQFFKKTIGTVDIDGTHVVNSGGTAVRRFPKLGPNAPCPCGSGTKYKKCCGRK